MYYALNLARVFDNKKNPSKLNAEEISNIEIISECCINLIKIKPTVRSVTLACYDILQEMREQGFKFFAPEHTISLAKTCIVYLLFDDFSRGPCYGIDNFRRRLEEYLFLEYASHHWGYHAREALSLGIRGADVSDDIQSFFKQEMNFGL